jgi:hypothetical protein
VYKATLDLDTVGGGTHVESGGAPQVQGGRSVVVAIKEMIRDQDETDVGANIKKVYEFLHEMLIMR